RIFLNHCSGLICIAPPQRKLYVNDFITIPATVLPLASMFRPEESISSSGTCRSITRRLVYCGRYSPYVDINSIFGALHNTRYLGLSFVWIGIGGENNKSLQQRIDREGLSDLVELREWVPHKEMVDYLMREAYVGLASYKKYFFSLALLSPTKILDYFAAGLPVIAPRLPTTEHIVHDRENGLFFEPENPESLAGAITEIFTDKKLYLQLCEGARLSAQEFSWEKRSEKLMKFIESVQNRPCPRPSTSIRRSINDYENDQD
ncbi:MAG: glycosyltransferase, partial [Chitinivibrionales bacterium]|nr:glycosyltransferase [Chitinivibrionales bacterium]